MSLSPIQIFENARGIIRLGWDYDNSGDVLEYVVLGSPRQSGPFLELQRAPNVVGYNVYVISDVLRSTIFVDDPANTIPLGKADTYYFKVQKVLRDDPETPIDLYPTDPMDADSGFIKMVYPDGNTLSNVFAFEDVDIQREDAEDVEFRSADVFNGCLQYIYITRSASTSIDIEVFVDHLDPASFDIPIYVMEDVTDKNIRIDLQQAIHLTENSTVRVKTTGVSGGSFVTVIGRRKFLVPNSVDI